MDASDLPTFNTYLEIFQGTIDTWSSCDPWAQPRWASTLIFYYSFLVVIFYLYVVLIVLVSKKIKKFTRPFHACIIILAVGDLVTLLTTFKDGAIQTCVLTNSVARHLAWESIGAFGIDLIISVNVVIAVVRLRAIFTLSRGGQRKDKTAPFLYALLFLATTWGCAIFYLHCSGLIKRIWFTKSGYHDEFFFPFNFMRNDLLFVELGLTFLLYVVASWQLKRVKSKTSLKVVRKEVRLLLLAFLIFFTELLYVYTSNWVGFNFFHLGSAEFNANLNYVVRPLTTGITPVLYIVFSAEVRRACFFCFRRNRGPKVTSFSKPPSVVIHKP